MALKCVLYLELLQHLGLEGGGGAHSSDKKHLVSRAGTELW